MNKDQDIIVKLEKLSKLYSDGHLSDEEFTLAKKKLLSTESNSNNNTEIHPKSSRPLPREFQRYSDDDDLGRAANRYVSLQTVMFVVVGIVFCIFAVSMCSERKKFRKDFNSFPNLPSNQ